jgi:hypothetical protein
MAKTNPWQDEYWLPALQLYLRKPVGVKPLYQRDAVQLCIELHVAPKALHERLEQIALLSTPRLERIWQTYSENPRRLARAVRLWREMKGFGAADEFYEGVEVQETFEKDFRPLDEDGRFTPAALILVLDLYFQLVPQTMVAQTPEVAELARLIGATASQVEELLHLYQLCDPYLNRNEVTFSNLLLPCQQVWQRFQHTDPNELSAFAKELKEYFVKKGD